MPRYCTVRGHYRSDNVDADFTATAEGSRYSDEMPGDSISNIDLDALSLLGVEINPITEFGALPEKLQRAVMALAGEVEWETEEADYDAPEYEWEAA